MADLVKVATPVGELWYSNITGQGKKNYNEDGFVYTSTLHLKGDNATLLKDKINEVLGPIPKGKLVKSVGYRELLEDADGIYTPSKKTVERDKSAKPTGVFAFVFSTGVAYEDGRPKTIAVYNKDAQKVNMGDRLIGNASKGAISGNLKRYESKDEVGVSLFLNALQLTEYVPYEGNAGFDKQEGGFSSPTDGETGFTGNVETNAQPAEVTQTKPRL